MKRKLGGETTTKMTTYKDAVFASILSYMEQHDVGFSVAVHDIVTAGFEAQERELDMKTDQDALQTELDFLKLRFRNIEKATRDLGDVVFPEPAAINPENNIIAAYLDPTNFISTQNLKDIVSVKSDLTGIAVYTGTLEPGSDDGFRELLNENTEVLEQVAEIKVNSDLSDENNSTSEEVIKMVPQKECRDIGPKEEDIYGPLKCFRCHKDITGDDSYPADAKMHVHLADCTGMIEEAE